MRWRCTIAAWDARNLTWTDGKVTFPTEAAAVASVEGARGEYRVSRVDESGYADVRSFLVERELSKIATLLPMTQGPRDAVRFETSFDGIRGGRLREELRQLVIRYSCEEYCHNR